MLLGLMNVASATLGLLAVGMKLPREWVLPCTTVLATATERHLGVSFIPDVVAYLESNDSSVFWLLIGLSFTGLLLAYLNRPLVYIKRLEECGYIPDGLHSMETIANNTRKRRQGGDLPPPFPNGWFAALDSRELRIGEVRQVPLLGQLLAVYRGEDGVVGVLDAYCPHLGANLAVGGVVSGCELQCPFHGWKFNREGKCTEIPYSEGKVPEFAKTKSWISKETNGQILVWFDAEGREPFWEPMDIENVNNGAWKCRGVTEGYINAHIQEVPENGADIHHLNFLHSPWVLNGTDLRKTRKLIGILDHTWVASWTPLEAPNGHIANLKLSHRLAVFGFKVSLFDFYVDAYQCGPSLVYLTWHFCLGRGAFFQTMTPVEPMLQKVSHSVWTDWWIPPMVASLLMMAEIRQVERDIMIWNNKRFLSKPLLVKEDKLIGQFRRWYTQFYSESSRDFGAKNNTDW